MLLALSSAMANPEVILTQLTSDLAQLKQVTDQQVNALGTSFAELKQSSGAEIDVVKTMVKSLNDKVDAIKSAADAKTITLKPQSKTGLTISQRK